MRLGAGERVRQREAQRRPGLLLRPEAGRRREQRQRRGGRAAAQPANRRHHRAGTGGWNVQSFVPGGLRPAAHCRAAASAASIEW